MTTFLTMSCIIFVQPAVLSGVMFGRLTGMDFGAVTTATCLAAAGALAVAIKFALPHLESALVSSPLFADSALVQRFEIADHVVAAPPSLAPMPLQMDVSGALALAMAPIVAIFLFWCSSTPWAPSRARRSAPAP